MSAIAPITTDKVMSLSHHKTSVKISRRLWHEFHRLSDSPDSPYRTFSSFVEFAIEQEASRLANPIQHKLL